MIGCPRRNLIFIYLCRLQRLNGQVPEWLKSSSFAWKVIGFVYVVSLSLLVYRHRVATLGYQSWVEEEVAAVPYDADDTGCFFEKT